MNLDEEELNDDWKKYLCGDFMDSDDEIKQNDNNSGSGNEKIECGELYISTKTIISYLNKNIDLNNIFWNIPINDYNDKNSIVIKKEMKFICLTEDESKQILNKTREYRVVNDYIINQTINPNGRIKYKVVRKISLGVCKKDILNCRSKQKGAFYNCFVIIIRIPYDNKFKEVHVKIFNTGKMEIPGITNNLLLNKVLDTIINLFKPLLGNDLACDFNKNETVLVNSNFNCGHFINREKLFNLLTQKYNIRCIYDPCSYPGIQCKYKLHKCDISNECDILEISEYHTLSNLRKKYKKLKKGNEENTVLIDKLDAAYNKLLESHSIEKEIAFMIFRTGSVLIVGKCDDNELYDLYNHIKTILIDERNEILENVPINLAKHKKQGIRKRKIMINKNN